MRIYHYGEADSEAARESIKRAADREYHSLDGIAHEGIVKAEHYDAVEGRAMRDVLLGADPPVRLTRRALTALAAAWDRHGDHVWSGGSVITRNGGDVRWWTWAGTRANLTLRATLAGIAEPGHQVHDSYLRLREDVDPAAWATARDGAADRIDLPEVSEKALEGLKFTAALPPHLAARTLAARLADVDGARALLAEVTPFVAA